MSLDLSNKVAIVTGSSSGIGLASVRALLDANASVLAIDITPAPSSLPRSDQEPRFRFHQSDITAPSAAAAAVQLCHEVFGPRIDILQNVAGVMDSFNSADSVADEAWEKVMAVNLTAPLKLMRAVLPVMKAQGAGAIVNVSSAAGLCGFMAGVAYTSSKHGLVSETSRRV